MQHAPPAHPASRRRPSARLARLAGAAAGLLVAGPLLPAAATPAPDVSPGPDRVATGAAPARELHVSPDGDDAAKGTERRPLRTIGAAVARARAGQRIVVASGTYHETVEVPADKPGLSLVAAPGATVTMDGASPVDGFQPSGRTWVRAGWTTQFDHSPTYTFGQDDGDRDNWTFINPEHPMAAHPDQVWVDGVAQRQVGSADQVGPGTFFVDDAGDRLVLGTDPTGRLVEASTLIRALELRAADVTVDGIDVRRYAPSVPHMGAVTVERDGITIRRSTISQNATTGLHVLGDHVRLRQVTFKANGMKGMGGTDANDLRLDRVKAIRNNLERFNVSPSAGGIKIGRSQGIRVTRSLFRGNIGTGLWFDESAYDILVAGSTMRRNSYMGLRFEISGQARAIGNLIADNGADGLNVNDSDHVSVWNNTFVGNVRPINVVQDRRDLVPNGSWRNPSLPLTWRNSPVDLRNNVVVAGPATAGCLLCVEDYSRRWSGQEMQISADGNLYQPLPGAATLALWPGAAGRTVPYASIGALRAGTGQESQGRTSAKALVEGRRSLVTSRTARLARSVAVRLPADVAALLGVRTGSRRLGAG